MTACSFRKGRAWIAHVQLNAWFVRRAVRTEEVEPYLLVDFAEDGTVLGIEVLRPWAVSSQQILRVFDHVGLERPSASEPEPLGTPWTGAEPEPTIGVFPLSAGLTHLAFAGSPAMISA